MNSKSPHFQVNSMRTFIIFALVGLALGSNLRLKGCDGPNGDCGDGDDCHPKCQWKCDEPVCNHPLCHTECSNPEPACESVCEEPVCDWKCHRPSNCPKPKCALVCEKSPHCQEQPAPKPCPVGVVVAGCVSVQPAAASGVVRQVVAGNVLPA